MKDPFIELESNVCKSSTRDLLPGERKLVLAMQQIGFGRIQSLRIENGQLLLDPWPMTVRGVKFGATEQAPLTAALVEFELKRQVIELFHYVRSLSSGEILCLEVRHGLPFSMEIEHRPGGRRGFNG